MASQTDVINLAIYKLGQSETLATIADDSKYADIMNRLWEPTLDLCLSHGDWPWATRSQALAVDIEAAQPGWEFRYAYPNDCIKAVALTDAAGLRAAGRLANFCSPTWRDKYWGAFLYDWEKSYGTQGTTINADIEQAYLVYVVRVSDTNRFTPGFVEALASLLATQAAPAIIGESGFNSKANLQQEYRATLSEALAIEYNESRLADNVTPSLMARGGD